jgi:hypothetical protein
VDGVGPWELSTISLCHEVICTVCRLSRQESWQIRNDENRAALFVCHRPSQCQTSSVCVSRQQYETWNVVISNSGADWRRKHLT